MSLDAYLANLPGRCSGCGYHVKTQGCACVPVAPSDEWRVFWSAVCSVARDGRVHQSDVRPLIRGRIEPKHIGQLYKRARNDGLLVEVDHERSNDEAGRNTHHWSPIYELRGAA